MMILLVVLGLPLAWKVNGVRARRRAVEAIERMGGHVAYDYEYLAGKAINGGNREERTGAALDTLGKVESLEWLLLEGTEATAAGVAKLQETRPSNTIIRMRSL